MHTGRSVVALATLAVSVLIQYDDPRVLVGVDPGAQVSDPAAYVAVSACPYLTTQRLDLPVPFELVWHKKSDHGSVVPDESRPHVTGLLTRCP